MLTLCEVPVIEAGEMAQWVKALATKPKNWSLIPRIHKVDGQVVF